MLEVSRDHVVATSAGRRRVDALAAELPETAWQRLNCGNGAKGRRWYDWALVATDRPEISLLIRRSVARPSELAFYLCHTPQPVPLAVLLKVAGTRWPERTRPTSTTTRSASTRLGYRYVTIAMLALAWLAVTRAALADGGRHRGIGQVKVAAGGRPDPALQVRAGRQQPQRRRDGQPAGDRVQAGRRQRADRYGLPVPVRDAQSGTSASASSHPRSCVTGTGGCPSRSYGT